MQPPTRNQPEILEDLNYRYTNQNNLFTFLTQINKCILSFSIRITEIIKYGF